MPSKAAWIARAGVLVLVAGCGRVSLSLGGAAAPVLQPQATSSTPSPIMEATVGVSELAAESNQCLDCHSDKQQLIDSARPEEAMPEESSGVG